MAERTIAEIIGWEWRGQRIYNPEDLSGVPPRHYGPETGRGYWAPPGVEVLDIGCIPNVDDILNWISSQPEFMYDNGMSCAITILGGRRSYSPDSGYVVVLEDRDGDELASDPQPTCLEALEQCVRILDTHRRENPNG